MNTDTGLEQLVKEYYNDANFNRFCESNTYNKEVIQEIKNIAPKQKWVATDGKEFDTETELITYVLKNAEKENQDIKKRREKVKELYGENYKITDEDLPY